MLYGDTEEIWPVGQSTAWVWVDGEGSVHFGAQVFDVVVQDDHTGSSYFAGQLDVRCCVTP